MNGIIVYSELEETALGLLTKGRELATALNKPLSVALLGNEAAGQTDVYFTHGVYLGDDYVTSKPKPPTDSKFYSNNRT